jgi:hypothetical protein
VQKNRCATEVDEKLKIMLGTLFLQEKDIVEHALIALGIKIIWVSSHEHVPLLLNAIRSAA